MRVLAIDPGRGKCGVAMVEGGVVLEKKVIDRSELVDEVQLLKDKYVPDLLVVGNSTGSRLVVEELASLFPEDRVRLVDERESTLEGRRRYFLEHPPRGLWRLVPLSLRYPPEPFDDLVAVILAERFMSTQTS